jgi:hypothetical protein
LADLAVDLYIAGKLPRARTEQGVARAAQIDDLGRGTPLGTQVCGRHAQVARE